MDGTIPPRGKAYYVFSMEVSHQLYNALK